MMKNITKKKTKISLFWFSCLTSTIIASCYLSGFSQAEVVSPPANAIHADPEVFEHGEDAAFAGNSLDDNTEDGGLKSSVALVENEDGSVGYVWLHPNDKRAAYSNYANMLRLDRRAANPALASMLRLDKRFKNYVPGGSSYLRLDKKAFNNNNNFANMLRLDKKPYSNLLRLDKKSNYNPSSFNSMLRLDKKAEYNPGFASMLRLDKKSNYNPGFNSMLRLDKKYNPNYNAFSNQLRLDKKSFKSSLRNFGLLRPQRASNDPLPPQ